MQSSNNRLIFNFLMESSQIYRRSKLIGSGGFGEIWEAIDETNTKRVALKSIRSNQNRGPNLLKKEIKILLKLKQHKLASKLFTFDSLDVPEIFYHDSNYNFYT